MRKCLLGVLFVCSLASAYAQVPSPDTLGSVIILKVTPLALFDLDNTVQAGIEVPLWNPAWTVQQEVGYGHSAFNLWHVERDEHPHRETWRSRSQIRYYFHKRNQQSAYIAGEYLFKKNSEEQFESVGYDCTGGRFNQQCAYFKNQDTHLGRFVNAFHIKWGGQIVMGERWLMDIYLGLGIRALNVRYLGLPRNTRSDDQVDFFSIRTDIPGRYRPTGSLSMGFHFGYRL
ncbi:DUF3575 domain-containing protein [Salmonirosea aquatica]|uniref:DUF3575 domain-containing protein n=1 Tax=Salmonirosea aquatica TaxID=2654236 RepID=A0A7C9F4L7_9BACT|nr:DUF3575 domain-containing protein [Cytophagaceae bacterium SJW1-29]